MADKIDTYLYKDKKNDLLVHVNEHKDGGICPYYVLEGQPYKQAAAYASILRDLQECRESIIFLNRIKNSPRVPQIVKTSLLFSAVVRYAKCFTQGEGRGTSLNVKDTFKGNQEKLLDFHNTTMDMRHKYLAHAGNSILESRAMVLILNPNEKNIETINYAGFKLKDDDENLEKYIELIDGVTLKVREKIEKIRPIINKKAHEMDLNEVYENSVTPDPKEFIPFNVGLMK